MNEPRLNCCETLPSGLQVWRWLALDCYVGTREALVLEGIAQADWFPSAIAPLRHVFTIDTALGRIKLVARSGNEWEVDVPVSGAERERREQQYLRQVKADRGAQIWEEGQFEREDAELRRSITLAPPVEPGSLSESELRHLRLMRTVGHRTRDSILDFTERLLLADARYGELAQRQPPRLVLAVDNTRAGQ